MGSRHTQNFFVLASILFGLSGSGWAAANLPVVTDVSPSRVAEGDTLTVSGLNLTAKDKITTIRIDQETITAVRVVDAKNLEVILPKRGKKISDASDAGEYPRIVQVVVSDPGNKDPKLSNEFTVTELTWGMVRQPGVFIPLAVFLIGILGISLSAKSGVFKSETGQLSLSKIQMGAWTFVFGLFYVLLTSIWGEFLDITEGMFWLMGISATTAVGAKAIAVKKPVPVGAESSKLLSEYDETTKTYRLSLHRCQIAIWSLIVLSIFVVNTITNMHLAEIPENLLVLMGISGGTYLGFKY